MLERNIEPLPSILEKCGIKYFTIGYIPFENILTGLEDIDTSIPHFSYGSTKIPELGKKYGLTVFFEPEWFNPCNWVGKRDDLLNFSLDKTTVSELKSNWVSVPKFIKSIDPKVLTGSIFEPEEHTLFLDEYTHLEDSDQLVVSDVCPYKIVQEWRFFLWKGEIVTGSQYRHDGILRTREKVSDETWKIARKMAEKWLPCENIVMDICLLESGEYKVVEFNCINSSGWYNSDIEKFILRIENENMEFLQMKYFQIGKNCMNSLQKLES